MSAHTEAVEAAARALCNDDRQQAGWPEVTDEEWPEVGGGSAYSRQSQVAITAYLRHMRAAGFVVTRVPGPKDPATTLYVSNDALAQEANHAQVRRSMVADANWAAGKVEGFNEAIAATLANAVGVGE